MHDDFSEGETGTDKVSCTSVDRRELNSPHPALTRSQTLATGFTFQVSQLGTNSHQIGLYPSQDLEGSQSSSPSSLLIFCLALCVQTIDIIYICYCVRGSQMQISQQATFLVNWDKIHYFHKFCGGQKVLSINNGNSLWVTMSISTVSLPRLASGSALLSLCVWKKHSTTNKNRHTKTKHKSNTLSNLHTQEHIHTHKYRLIFTKHIYMYKSTQKRGPKQKCRLALKHRECANISLSPAWFTLSHKIYDKSAFQNFCQYHYVYDRIAF